MKAHLRRRLEGVEDAIWTRPVPVEVARAAFDHFKATGVLPEDERIAATVARRVKTGIEYTGRTPTELDYQKMVRDVIRNGLPPEDPYRDALIKEAIWFGGEIRFAARFILQALTKNGCDFTGPVFMHRKVPKYGSVAMEIVGLPRRFVLPPYEEQGERLLARIEELRPRLPHGDRSWWQRARAALDDFPRQLPDDPLMLGAVLVIFELEVIRAHWEGFEVAELMAALAAVAKAGAGGRWRPTSGPRTAAIACGVGRISAGI